MEELAIKGGPKTKTTPFSTGRRFGIEEVRQVVEALDQNALIYHMGRKVKEFQQKFASYYGSRHCVATSSGTAALHVAVGALGVGPGDEVITAPVTDMGSLIGILYQNAIPVFADINPDTFTMSPDKVAEKISDKTKAIMVVHLTGLSCDMDPILKVAQQHKIKVIEDCAQSYSAEYKGRMVGTMGDMGCFSLNDYKHISVGDGGAVITNDPELARRAALFADKCYDREAIAHGANRMPKFLAANYRMSELNGAVGIAQLDRLAWIVGRRRELGDRLNARLRDVKGIKPQMVPDGYKHSYYLYTFKVDSDVLGRTADEFSKALAAEGIPNTSGGITGNLPVYLYDLFTKKNVYEGTRCPFDCHYYGRDVEYKAGLCPWAERAFTETISTKINEFYSDEDLEDIARGIRKVAAHGAR